MQRESIEQLVALKLKSAEAKFPKHNSAHESYAILREEYDETILELDRITGSVDWLWEVVKSNDKEKMKTNLNVIREHSVLLIEESIQVVAMCDRFKKDVLT